MSVLPHSVTHHARYSKLDDGLLAKFKLKRDVKSWGTIAGARVLFAWRPPWVKPSLVELYYNTEQSSVEDDAGIAAGSDSRQRQLGASSKQRCTLGKHFAA